MKRLRKIPPPIYMVQVNYGGITGPTRMVCKGVVGEEWDGVYWDKEGDLSCKAYDSIAPGLRQLVFKTRKEAMIAYRGMEILADHMREHLFCTAK